MFLQATAPEVTGVLTLVAHLGCTAEEPLQLTASGPEPQAFTAEFTPESPLNFDVVPAQGMLPPAAATANNPAGTAAPAQAGEPPLRVTFLCK